jgi:putative oxidoreductase
MFSPAQTAYALPVGRVALSAIFLFSGMAKITGFSGTVGYVASAGLPFPELALSIAIVVELLGGLAVLIGFQTRLAALALSGFTVAAAVLFHAYWSDADPQSAYVQQIMFWKNIAMAGGLLYVFQTGAGPLSIDALLEKRRS